MDVYWNFQQVLAAKIAESVILSVPFYLFITVSIEGISWNTEKKRIR